MAHRAGKPLCQLWIGTTAFCSLHLHVTGLTQAAQTQLGQCLRCTLALLVGCGVEQLGDGFLAEDFI